MRGICLDLFRMGLQGDNFFLTRFFPQYLPHYIFKTMLQFSSVLIFMTSFLLKFLIVAQFYQILTDSTS